MQTATLLNTTGCYRGTSGYTSNDSPFMLGKTADYTMRGRVGFAPIERSWYIKSIKLYMNRTDGYAGKTLKVGTSLSSAWGAALDWSLNIYASKGTGAKAWDLTAYKDILQGYASGFYFHFTHGSGDSSYCEWTAGSGGSAPRLVVEYEEATLTVPGGEFTIGTQTAITVGTLGSGLTHKLSYAIGTASGALNGGAFIDAGATVNWTPDAALANQITTAMVGTVTLTLESYLDGVLSSTVTLSYPLNVPASCVPTIGSATFSVSNPAGDEIGIYVQGRSRSICTISASSVYGASIVEYRLTLGGKTYSSSSSPITTDVLSLAGALDATVAVVDSRGQTATLTQAGAITVNAYAAPMITAFSVTRALVNGTVSNDGTYIKFTLSCVFAPLANENTRAGSIKFKLAGGEYSVPVPLTDAMAALGATAYSFTLTGVLGDGAIGSGSYVIAATLTDLYTSTSGEAELASRTIYFDLHSSGEGLAIGKVAETASLFDVGLDSRFDGVVSLGESGKLGNANLANNAAWRAGTSGWLLSANVARDEAVTLNGGCSLKCNQTGLSSPAWYGAGLADASRAACAAGDVFSASVYVLVQDSTTFDSTLSLELQVFDASGTRVQTNSAVLTPASADDGKWLRMEVNGATITAANAETCNIRFYVRQNGVVWFACPKLEKGPIATEFVASVEGDVAFKGAVNFDVAPGFANCAAAREKLGIQMGTVSTTLPINSTKTGVVTFPKAYKTAPTVMLTMDYLGSAGTGTVIKLFVVGCTATTFTWYIASSGSSAVACNVWWVSFGEPVAE